jgi:septation ring formation regulator EzrA
MSLNSKDLATFLLGAAAGFGAYKYMNMTDEEKEKLAASLKEKANKVKKTALDAETQATDYFHELKNKGADAMKEYMPKVEEFFESLFKGTQKTEPSKPSAS